MKHEGQIGFSMLTAGVAVGSCVVFLRLGPGGCFNQMCFFNTNNEKRKITFCT